MLTRPGRFDVDEFRLDESKSVRLPAGFLWGLALAAMLPQWEVITWDILTRIAGITPQQALGPWDGNAESLFTVVGSLMALAGIVDLLPARLKLTVGVLPWSAAMVSLRTAIANDVPPTVGVNIQHALTP